MEWILFQFHFKETNYWKQLKKSVYMLDIRGYQRIIFIKSLKAFWLPKEVYYLEKCVLFTYSFSLHLYIVHMDKMYAI